MDTVSSYKMTLFFLRAESTGVGTILTIPFTITFYKENPIYSVKHAQSTEKWLIKNFIIEMNCNLRSQWLQEIIIWPYVYKKK